MAVAAQRSWVMLAYRMPREPSTPRIVVWKRLRRLGVAQPVDGLALLPELPSTREGLEWVAEQVLAAGGWVTLWTATHHSSADETTTITQMNAAVAADYTALTAEAGAAAEAKVLAAASRVALGATSSSSTDRVALRHAAGRLGRALAQVQARDYFGADGRADAERAVVALASLARGPEREAAR